MRRIIVFTLAAAIAAAAAAYFILDWPTPGAPGTPWRPDIVLITIDTLRADRLQHGLTPAIDALAASGLRFTTARTTVPLTLPAHVSLMTGTLPPVHGVRENGLTFKPGPPLLARTLKNNGYRTAAFVGAYVLDRRFGLADGFDTYDDRVRRDPDAGARLEAERDGGQVVDAALAWLQPQVSQPSSAATQPSFTWIHLYDPHAPYAPPVEFLEKARGNAYDGEVAYADAQVARVIETLRAAGRLESTLVIVSGDHGEGLGEHGEATHGMLTYDSTLRVPLVIAGAGIGRAVVSSPVSLVDVVPTVLARMAIASADAASGLDLFSLPPDRDVYAESLYPRAAGWHPLSALAGDQWKLVLSSEPELYDIKQDPGEQRNVAAAHQRIVLGMSARLRQIQASAGNAAVSAVPADAAERLRALGYVSGSAPRPDSDAERPGPAREIASWELFERALSLVNAGRAEEALATLRDLASRFPAAPVFQATYARALKDSGNPREAMKVYRSAIAGNPADPAMFHDLAVAARAAGATEEALRAEQAALALDATNPAAHNGLGLLHVAAGRPAEAAQAFEQAATADPSNASYWANLGNARREMGDVQSAEEAYRRALTVDEGYPDAANGLGVVLVQRGTPKDAIRWFGTALQRSPDFHEARLNLGIAYQESGDLAKAAETYRQLLATAPATAFRERKAAEELLARLR